MSLAALSLTTKTPRHKIGVLLPLLVELAWVSILAKTGSSVSEIVHWQRFDRSYYQRHDFERLEPEFARKLMEDFSERFPHSAAANWPMVS